jgi:hypothetical protein
MGRVVPIHPSPLDMEFRSTLCNLIRGAKKEIVLFEDPRDGLCYLVVDGKHVARWAEPHTIVLYTESGPRFSDGRKISTLERLYGYAAGTEKRELYAEFESFPDGTYDFRLLKEIKL